MAYLSVWSFAEHDSAETAILRSINESVMTYELVAILSPKLSDDQVKAEQDAFRSLIEGADGKVLREDTWGKRELAYQIKHLSHGMYVQTDFEADSSFLDELNKQLRLREEVIRFLILKKEKGSGTLSDFTGVSEDASEEGEVSAPKTTEEAVATPDVLEASTKAETPAIDTTSDSKEEEVVESTSDSEEEEQEAPKAEKAAPAESKAGMEELDKKLDDLLDSTLDEEVK
ncbi:MAG: 30S ribosomal protein S6 [Candidatus Doudnabacteria bacterium]|nr:30S ribosomal protein S6 [Candidatus Doudnabacteria bacterium]